MIDDKIKKSIQQIYTYKIQYYTLLNKMKKDIILPLTTVNHYTRLPDGLSVKMFEKFLAEYSHQPEISTKQYFLATHSIKDAFLIACFCFGQLKFLDLLSSFPISTETINYLRAQMSQFSWNKMSALTTFEENSKKFGKIYPYYWQNVQKKLNEKDSQELFKRVKDNHLLFGVKIRRWKEQEEPIENYRSLQREYEQTELMRVDGTRYLLFAQTGSQTCNFGVLQQTYQIDSRLKYPNPSQAIQQIHPIHPIHPIEQITQKQKINSINTFDFYKKPTETGGSQFPKQKQYQIYQPKSTQAKNQETIKKYNQIKEPVSSVLSKQIQQNKQINQILQAKKLGQQKKIQQVKKFQEPPRIQNNVQVGQIYWGPNSFSPNMKNKQYQNHQYKMKSQLTVLQKRNDDYKIYNHKLNTQNEKVFTPSQGNNIFRNQKANFTSPVTNLTNKQFQIPPSKYQGYAQNQQQANHAQHRANPQEISSIQNQNIIVQNTEVNSNCCPNNCVIM